MVINGKFVKKLLTSVENKLFWVVFYFSSQQLMLKIGHEIGCAE